MRIYLASRRRLVLSAVALAVGLAVLLPAAELSAPAPPKDTAFPTTATPYK